MPKTKNRCWHRNKILQPFLPCFFIPRTTLISVYKVQTMPQAKHKRAAKVDMYRGKRLPVAWTRSRKSMGNITWVVCYPLSGRAHEKKKTKKKEEILAATFAAREKICDVSGCDLHHRSPLTKKSLFLRHQHCSLPTKH